MSIVGAWQNELGSQLVIDAVNDGGFSGTYTTAVSSGSCANGDFVVAGRTDTDTGGSAVGFTVVWLNNQSNCQSVTAWSGQLLAGGTISAFWLLTMETGSGQSWADTLIGQDQFWPIGHPALNTAPRPGLRHSHP